MPYVSASTTKCILSSKLEHARMSYFETSHFELDSGQVLDQVRLGIVPYFHHGQDPFSKPLTIVHPVLGGSAFGIGKHDDHSRDYGNNWAFNICGHSNSEIVPEIFNLHERTVLFVDPLGGNGLNAAGINGSTSALELADEITLSTNDTVKLLVRSLKEQTLTQDIQIDAVVGPSMGGLYALNWPKHLDFQPDKIIILNSGFQLSEDVRQFYKLQTELIPENLDKKPEFSDIADLLEENLKDYLKPHSDNAYYTAFVKNVTGRIKALTVDWKEDATPSKESYLKEAMCVNSLIGYLRYCTPEFFNTNQDAARLMQTIETLSNNQSEYLSSKAYRKLVEVMLNTSHSAKEFSEGLDQRQRFLSITTDTDMVFSIDLLRRNFSEMHPRTALQAQEMQINRSFGHNILFSEYRLRSVLADMIR